MTRFFLVFATVLLASVATLNAAEADKPQIRIGIIGCDTSHVPKFTQIINRAKPGDELSTAKVVAAYPGGSDDIPSSRDRVGKFTDELRAMNVQIVDSIDVLLPMVDAVLLESIDGRKHLEQVRPVFEAGKPVFIDKPFAASLADAIRIVRLAEAKNVPCFSSSSLRYSSGIDMLRTSANGDVLGCDAYSPCSLEPHHADLYWYGIHGVEILYTLMGTGCESVSRTHTDSTDLVVGTWSDGRIGTFRGTRDAAKYGGRIYSRRSSASADCPADYAPLVREIVKFFHTRKPPVELDVTLEMYTFMEAADEGKRRGGAPVKLSEVKAKAEAEVAAKH